MTTKNSKFIKGTTKFYLLALFLIVGLTHWRWLFSGAYFVWGDAQIYAWFKETWQGFVGFPMVWSTLVNGLGQIDITLSLYPIFSSFGILTRIGLDPRLVTKIIFFIPSAFLPSYCSFLLIKHFTKTNLSAFVGAIVYSYNVNTLLMQTGLQPLNIVYALAPLTLFLFIKTLETRSLKLSVLTGLVGFIGSVYEFRIFYIVSYVLLFYLMFHIFFIERKLSIKRLIKTMIYAFTPFLIVAVLNAYWLVPFIKSGSLQNNAAFSRPLFGDGYMSLKQSIAFFSPWWTGGHGYANFVVQPIPDYFWIIPILALLGFVLNFKNPKVYFFLFLSLLGILLFKQSDKPFPHLYLWLYQHFPGFNAYRESGKFFVILSLGYSALIAFFISALRFHKIIIGIIAVLTCSLFLWNIKPFVTGEIGAVFTPKNRPHDFDIFEEFIHRQPDFFRTAWLPASGIWGYFDLTHPKINLHTAYFDTLGKIIISQPGFSPATNESKLIADVNHLALNLFVQSNSNHLFDLLNIKYIVVPPEGGKNDDNVFINYGLPDRSYLVNLLDKTKYFTKVDIGTEQLIVYENSGYRPLIYATLEPENTNYDVPYQPVDFKRVNSTQFEIELKKLDRTTFINFSDAYNPEWNLSINGQPLPDKFHSDTNGLFNSFRLEPEYIKQHFGNIDKLTLSFRSQKYVYLGSLISLASLVFIMGILLVI